MNDKKTTGLTVVVGIKDTPQFEVLLSLFKQLVEDERIPQEIRNEYFSALESAICNA